ncbi:lytic transglycosylase domain-containing protein [Terriglobus roseus]|nr:lytic transglycosylase domain-containing protein [Terriglobus roseus]
MIQLPSRIRPLAAIAASACTVFLLGCPQQQTAAKPPANSTAPALPKTVGGNNAQTAEQTNPRIAELIQQVDRSYRSGVQNYRAGNLDGARSDFDHAVDLMLTSGLDIKSDPTLSDEFERTVDAVNSLEMDALKQGNGFSPKQEETPLEAVNDLTFSDATPEQTASLKSTLNTTSDLPLVINPEVAGYINAFANSRSFTAHMRASLERLGKYKDMMQGVLREEGVPQDMIYLAVAESGFQPQAMNASSGAGGMWQFMPFKGAYGLERNGYFDERFDPEKSTRAYAKYMKGLYDQFGDWYLAMGGYDWGPGNMQRAVQRTGYADYWELYRRNAMPRETKNYVPQILAAILMAKNPEKYGLTDLHPAAPVLYDTVTVDYAMDLHLAADITGASMTDLVGLNPALLRLSTPDGVPFDLHIPKGTKDNFNERIAAIPVEKRSSWRFHEVVAGESLDQVAQLYKVSAADILAANDLPANSAVEEGDDLVIPLVSAASASLHPLQYTTRHGDTLVTVADRFNVTTENLRQWNHLGSGTLPLGRKIYVAEPVRLAPGSRGRKAKTASKGKATTSHSTAKKTTSRKKTK